MNLEILKTTLFENIHNDNNSFHKHSHDTYTIGVTHEGMFKYINSNKSYYCYKSSTKISNPGELHLGQSQKWDYTNFYPSCELLTCIYEQIFFEKQLPFFLNHIIKDYKLYSLLCELFKSIYRKNEPIIIETNLISSISYLIKNYTNYTKDYEKIEDKKDIYKLSYEYINDNLLYNISLDELAKNVGLSKYHFLRVFKNEFGTTPYTYITNQKLKKASLDIIEGNTLINTSNTYGFSDQSHFIKTFKKVYGYTPSKLLDKNKIVIY